MIEICKIFNKINEKSFVSSKIRRPNPKMLEKVFLDNTLNDDCILSAKTIKRMKSLSYTNQRIFENQRLDKNIFLY